jgi:hypothetical protein
MLQEMLILRWMNPGFALPGICIKRGMQGLEIDVECRHNSLVPEERARVLPGTSFFWYFA